MYTFNKSDLVASAPRVLPSPLMAGAVFFSGRYPSTFDAEQFLVQHGVSTNEPRSRWMCFVWDATGSDLNIAQAVYSWDGSQVIREAVHIEPVHEALALDAFLDGMGSALFGGSDVYHPEGGVDWF